MTDQHTTVQYQLRLPEELRDKIKKSAKAHSRSMNADIVARLESSFAINEVYFPGYIPGYDSGERYAIGDDLFDEAGLTKEEFVEFVRLFIKKGLQEERGKQ
ncbi:Arc family DNA-binding protein [Psychrobacter celer]|uniref:Arc family DNA-binding protein n=1 Tax=Psychrobacter celer TaxID=306572 RepID=UPI003FD172F5